MKVINIHERRLASTPQQVGVLVDSLASEYDRLWANTVWPAMRFDRPLGIGAEGGHGPIRYRVEAYTPAAYLRFRFTGPRGFDGFHAFEIEPAGCDTTLLRHCIRMHTRGVALLSWPLVYRPMHDALIEDTLSRAQSALGETPAVRPWSTWVKMLRWILSAGKAPQQPPPDRAGGS